MNQAFSNIKVVDFTQVLAGPFASQQLALLGADVVKIESPGFGDQSRLVVSEKSKWEPVLFLCANSGKRSMTLDLKKPESNEIIRRLLEKADVVIENFRPGVMDRLGLGYKAISEINPRIVYCSLSGYGQEGPYNTNAAFDPVIQAECGLMSMTGFPETGPVRTGFPVSDTAAGLMAAYAIAGALFRRECCGKGQYLDVSMLDSMITLQNSTVFVYLHTGEKPTLQGNGSHTGLPTMNTYPTRDSYIQISFYSDAHYQKMCELISRPDLIEDSRFHSMAMRQNNASALAGEIKGAFAAKDTQTWLDLFLDAKLPAGMVRDVEEVANHPQLEHRDLIMELPPLSGSEKPFKTVGTGFKANQGSPSGNRRPPELGEHTKEVLAELGFQKAEIAEFIDKGVV
ncbi:MAG: CoA transferase [Proteobacteria bacterium]|nr:CoA transferase [Pseudomonadota bacterium]